MTFLLFVLTVWSITRLIITDGFPPLVWLREDLLGEMVPDDEGMVAVYPFAKLPPWMAYLANCFFCLSVWIGYGVVIVWALVDDVDDIVWLWPIAARVAVGLLASVEDLIEVHS